MHATKETCVLAYLAMALAILGKLTWRRWAGYPIRIRPFLNPRHLAAALLAAGVASGLFFSSFLRNPRGPLDALRAYTTYVGRAGEIGLHQHPWHYYLKMLLYTQYARGPWWSEGLILILALFGFASVMVKRSAPEARAPLVRFVAFYTLFLTAAYAVIPYKTPWCLLGFLHGMILLAGVGAVVLVELVPTRPAKAAVCIALAIAACNLGAQAYRTSFKFQADRRNPYVYAHTSSDLLNLVQRVEDIAKVSPDGSNMLIKMVVPEADYWPLPWYLRRFRQIDYWPEPPAGPGAPMVIAAEGVREAVEAKLGGHYHQDYFGLRPTVLLLAYTREDLWEAFLKTRAAPAPQTGKMGR
jgi:predicted membrane-bound mannosyltransferase